MKKKKALSFSNLSPLFVENMDGSPGNTLRERNRRINSPPTSPIQDDPDDGTHIEMLQSSPGSRRSHDVQPSRVSHHSSTL